MRITKDSFELHAHPAAPPVALKMAATVFTMGASACTESYVMSRMLAEGPKVFAFDALTCEALENFDLSVSTGDYLQPFPSVVIELPADYSKKRVVPFEAGSHAPDFVIVRHEPEAGCVLLAMHLSSHQVLTRLLKLDPAWTLEEMWEKGKRAWDAKDTLGMTPEEAELGSALSKLALNVCLMATAYEVRRLGPANSSHFEPLFHREPATEHHQGSDKGGWTVSPHWRRGHWRWQPCGPGRQERRRVAIPSVLVNGHLFMRSPADTVATYRVPNR
jgi:hypothetical protein